MWLIDLSHLTSILTYTMIVMGQWQGHTFMHWQGSKTTTWSIPLSNHLLSPAQTLVNYSKTLIRRSRFSTYGFFNSTRGSVLRLNCKRRQFVPPCTAAQGFSPGHSADGSLICSRGGPLCKEPALVENSFSALLFYFRIIPVIDLKSRLL